MEEGLVLRPIEFNMYKKYYIKNKIRLYIGFGWREQKRAELGTIYPYSPAFLGFQQKITVWVLNFHVYYSWE